MLQRKLRLDAFAMASTHPDTTPRAREAFSFLQRGIECSAINVAQGAWVVEQDRVLRTILGSCVSVCLYDPVARIGGMNHYVFVPSATAGTSTLHGDVCMEGLMNAVLARGAVRARLRAKAFGAGAMFPSGGGNVVPGKCNSRFARYWLEQEGIPLDLTDFHGTCARKLMFHPGSGQHWCQRIPTPFFRTTVGNRMN